jgi:hypothetical protein
VLIAAQPKTSRRPEPGSAQRETAAQARRSPAPVAAEAKTAGPRSGVARALAIDRVAPPRRAAGRDAPTTTEVRDKPRAEPSPRAAGVAGAMSLAAGRARRLRTGQRPRR